VDSGLVAGLGMLSQALFSSTKEEWETPPEFFKELDSKFWFTLDPCATKKNAKCDRFFTKEVDGLRQDWSSERVFMNPPYGRTIGKWMEKAWESVCAGATVVCLVPARTSERWWHAWVEGKATEIRFVKGRLRFVGAKHTAPFPSVVIVYRPGAEPLHFERKVWVQIGKGHLRA